MPKEKQSWMLPRRNCYFLFGSFDAKEFIRAYSDGMFERRPRYMYNFPIIISDESEPFNTFFLAEYRASAK